MSTEAATSTAHPEGLPPKVDPDEHKKVLKQARLIQHRAEELVRALEHGDLNWILLRYRKLGEATSFLKREFKKSTLDRR